MDNKKELTKLGKKVQRIRAHKKLSQEDLAFNCNKDQQSISRLENGGINPSYIYLLELCKGLGVKLEELVSERT